MNYNEQSIGFPTTQIGWIGGANNPTFGTIDGGATWTQTPWGDYLNRFQFRGPTLGYGSGVTVYKYSDPALVAAGDPPGSPRKRVLPSLPNPFVARTTIRYELAAPTRVTRFVADPSGRVVRRLAEGPEEGGGHRVDWDGRDDAGRKVPAGVYLHVLHAAEMHEMGKLVRLD